MVKLHFPIVDCKKCFFPTASTTCALCKKQVADLKLHEYSRNLSTVNVKSNKVMSLRHIKHLVETHIIL